MDQDQTLIDLKKRLRKLQVDIEVINLYGDYGAPVKRADLEAEIRDIERKIDECGNGKDTGPNSHKN